MPGVNHVPYPYCYRCPFNQTYPDCHYWCIDFIDEFVFHKYVPPEDVAAIIFEPIQGEGGYIVPPPGYFQKLKKLADRYGILLIDDEVQSGMGRTGKWFGIENWTVEPDILCSAKALASGLPLGATIADAKVMDWVGGSHASTFGGNPLSCVAATTVIDVIKREGLLENATKLGVHVIRRLEEWKEQNEIIGDVRGKGLMIGMEIVENKETRKAAPEKAKRIMVHSWKRGVAAITCGVSTVRIAPPLTIGKELLDAALEIIGDVVKEVGKEI